MKQFKIRCSQIGQIMTNPRSKTELLSKTTITYMDKYRKEELYGRREEITSKQMDKGIQMEAEAIELAARYYNWGMVFKNEKELHNDFMTGTPDVILSDTVIDIKCPWSCFTFPLFDQEPDKNYWWQLQGYMALTGLEKAKLVYCLMDLPEDLLESEIYYAQKRNVFSIEEEVRAYHTYSNLPDKMRIKSFDIARDQAAIDSIYTRVEECREYYIEMVQILAEAT